MSAIAKVNSGRSLTEFNPEKHRLTVAAIDYGIEEAKRIKDWPALEEAVDLKIDEQRKFVAWWHLSVRRKGKKANNRDRGYFVEQAEELTGLVQQRVSDLVNALKAIDKYRVTQLGSAYRKAMLEAAENHRAEGTGENEWYTPAKYIEMARDVLGEFDLDPATSEVAQRVVQARKFFTKSDNGLEQQWEGRVWLNPPYMQPLIGQFVEKLVEERCADRVSAAILLTHNYTDTAWFHGAMEIADAVCFTRGRIKFVDSEGGECAPTQGQAFFYFGDHTEGFAARFKDIGFVVFPCVSEAR